MSCTRRARSSSRSSKSGGKVASSCARLGIFGIEVGVGSIFDGASGGIRSNIEKVLLERLSEGFSGGRIAGLVAERVDALN